LKFDSATFDALAAKTQSDIAKLKPSDTPGQYTTPSTRFLGRQVTYSVNAVNQIAVLTTAVPTSGQKSSVATITVLYVDPIFEVSTGALLSTMPNRTFANQTLVTGNSGGLQTTGNVVISQSIIRPIVLPYAAANWRIGHDFLMPDKHRGAVYFTTAVAFNAYNTTAEVRRWSFVIVEDDHVEPLGSFRT
jgi:hypothetical protein